MASRKKRYRRQLAKGHTEKAERIKRNMNQRQRAKLQESEALDKIDELTPEQEAMLRENYEQQQEQYERKREIEDQAIGRWQDQQIKERELWNSGQDIYGRTEDLYGRAEDIYGLGQDSYEQGRGLYERGLGIADRSENVWGAGQDMYDQGQDVYGESWNVYDQGQEMYDESWNLYDQGQDVYEQGQEASGLGYDLYDRGEDIYGQGQEMYGLGQELYGQGQNVYAQGQGVYDASGQQYDYAQEQQGRLGGIQESLMGAAGYDVEGGMTGRGESLQGSRDALLGISGAYRGIGSDGGIMSAEEQMQSLPEQDRMRQQALMDAYGGLSSSQTAAPGEYLGSKAVEASIADAQRIQGEQDARGGRMVGSSAKAAMDAEMAKQAGIARDTAQMNAINTYQGLVSGQEATARAKEAALSGAFGDITQSTQAGMQNLLTGAGLSSAGTQIGQSGFSGLGQGYDAINQGLGAAATGMQGAGAGYGAAFGGLQGLGQGYQGVLSGQQGLREGYGAAGQGLESVRGAYSSMGQGLGGLSQGYNTMGQGYGALGQGYGALGAGQGIAQAGYGALNQGIGEMQSGLAGLGGAIGQQESALGSLGNAMNSAGNAPGYMTGKGDLAYADFTSPYSQFASQLAPRVAQTRGQNWQAGQNKMQRDFASQEAMKQWQYGQSDIWEQNKSQKDLIWESMKAQNVLNWERSNQSGMMAGAMPSGGGGGGMGMSEAGGMMGGLGGLISAIAGAWSDERLKRDITPLPKGLKEIEALEPVYYNFRWEVKGSKPKMGFIAQQIEDVIPDVVTGDDMKRIDMMQIVPLLVNAVKELSKEIKELKNGMG